MIHTVYNLKYRTAICVAGISFEQWTVFLDKAVYHSSQVTDTVFQV